VAGHCGGARQVERRRMVRGCLGVWNEGKWAGARERERGEPGSGSAGSAGAQGRGSVGARGEKTHGERARGERARGERERCCEYGKRAWGERKREKWGKFQEINCGKRLKR
jgi:hypothetical protein